MPPRHRMSGKPRKPSSRRGSRLEDAPLQDTPKQRDQTAAMARENAEKAERQLEKLRDDIQRSEPQLQDYAQLKELEQQQRELARQADCSAGTPPANGNNNRNAWPRH